MSAVKKTRSVTRRASVTYTTEEVDAAVLDMVKREHRDLKDYHLVIGWSEGGGCTVTGTQTSGDGETADA